MTTSVTSLPKEELSGRPIDSSALASLTSYLLDGATPCNRIPHLITPPTWLKSRGEIFFKGGGLEHPVL
jgi:hypothetical protein